MKVVSTNIAKPQWITINGKKVKTGIYKKPTLTPIFLDTETVKNDEVSNRKYHGGEFKACYLFSADHYPYWESLYPTLDWHYGMLGENLTIEGLDENKLIIGAIYKIGNALVQITQPREPCNTFAAKMGNPAILKQFINHGKPGTYVKVLEPGNVKTGDILELVEQPKNSITTAQFFELLFSKDKNQEHLQLMLENEAIPLKKRIKLKTHLKS
ncbi:MOSC domain-containing protein [Pontimicrobium sp. IMCC45349]|uniref:MOSC domain-containing protein n=1 Tax=Pontimicrobium sp. IMCC45349 TaxID=3391574 RepID=UPI0039A1BB6C